MSIYIVRPKVTEADRAVAGVARKLDRESRRKQVEEVSSLTTRDPVTKQIHSWVADATNARLVTVSESDTPVTGTSIVDMPDDEAARMQREMGDAAVVVENRPIDLIPPDRATATAKKAPASADLWHLRKIGLASAQKNGFTGKGIGVTIAVLDTGVDQTHPELAQRVADAVTFDVNQWTWSTIVPSADTHGHGTHVAGLICGQRVGVAPGAEVASGVMLPGGHGDLASFILALEWAASRPEVQVINMSAGIPGYLPEMKEVIGSLLRVGILFVAATGNEGRNRTRSPGNYVEALSVGATDRNNRVAGFSSGGTLTVDHQLYTVPDLVAPGKGVYSSLVGGGYEAWDGTSMATPIVSGVAALILEKYPDISVTDLTDELVRSCKNLREKPDRQGEGLVQVQV